jgi:hypothetical protein
VSTNTGLLNGRSRRSTQKDCSVDIRDWDRQTDRQEH